LYFKAEGEFGKMDLTNILGQQRQVIQRIKTLSHKKSNGTKEMKRLFTLEYWKDDGWFVGKLKEIPGVFSQGKTLDELKENIIDAYRMMLEEYETVEKHAGTKRTELGVEV
jgi:predicted RNase H-like HicB family nuclease